MTSMGLMMGVKKVQGKTQKMDRSLPITIDPAFRSVSKNSTNFLIWRVEKMQLLPLAKSHYGTFHTEDAYIVYVAAERGKIASHDMPSYSPRGPLEVHIHFWLGAECSTDSATMAAYKSVELDTYLGGSPVQHREVQNSESPRFKSYFKSGIRLLIGGVEFGQSSLRIVEPRLFQVRGRRSPVLLQMPEISWRFFNSGDAFILDTKDVIFVWIGKFSNSLEKLQAAKIAKKLMEEHHALSIVFVDDGKEMDLPQSEKLLLGVYLDLNKRNLVRDRIFDDDKSMEILINSKLKMYHCSEEDGTYKVVEAKTGPLHQSDLHSSDSFIIDNCGHSVWAWIGKHASMRERNEGIRNAHGFVKKKGYSAGTPVCRVIEGGEPPEFKALFLSWKDKDDLNFGFTLPHGSYKASPKSATVKLDAASLHRPLRIQNGSMESILNIIDSKMEVWRVSRSVLKEVPFSAVGRFYTNDCYLIHYSYNYAGKNHHVLYYWLGLHSTVMEQTALAYHTVAEDERLGGIAVQVRVVEGKEPPHFLHMFRGRLLIMQGDHSDEMPRNFMLQVRGTSQETTRAYQVHLRAASLNTNYVYVLKLGKDEQNYIWCGRKSTGDERDMAKHIAEKYAPQHLVLYEGQEKETFWEDIGGRDIYSDKRLPENPVHCLSPRLFCCSSPCGYLKVEEVVHYQQTDLMPEDIMIMDTWETLFIWIGAEANQEEKRSCIQLAIEYLKSDPSGRDVKIPIVLIKQGHEPPVFTSFFARWDDDLWKSHKTFGEVRKELENAKPTIQVELKLNTGPAFDFEDYPKYPFHNLIEKEPEKLPKNVDLLHKEMHLNEKDFAAVFGMRYKEFAKFPKWKQDILKKDVGLF
nr:PREDICTED: advillin-like [Bemisia tabaci]